eukprot:4664018-Pleurochrysis_carterae.AAC.2
MAVTVSGDTTAADGHTSFAELRFVNVASDASLVHEIGACSIIIAARNLFTADVAEPLPCAALPKSFA